MKTDIADLKKELEVTDKLLEERNDVLKLIPECPTHGFCLPHFKDWINERKSDAELLERAIEIIDCEFSHLVKTQNPSNNVCDRIQDMGDLLNQYKQLKQ